MTSTITTVNPATGASCPATGVDGRPDRAGGGRRRRRGG